MTPTHIIIPIEDIKTYSSGIESLLQTYKRAKIISLNEEDIETMCTKAHLKAWENSDNKAYSNGVSFDTAYKQALKDILK